MVCFDTYTNITSGATNEEMKSFWFENSEASDTSIVDFITEDSEREKKRIKLEEEKDNIILFKLKRETNKNKFMHCRSQNNIIKPVQRKMIYR